MTKSSNWKIISNITECQAGMMRYSNWMTRRHNWMTNGHNWMTRRHNWMTSRHNWIGTVNSIFDMKAPSYGIAVSSLVTL